MNKKKLIESLWGITSHLSPFKESTSESVDTDNELAELKQELARWLIQRERTSATSESSTPFSTGRAFAAHEQSVLGELLDKAELMAQQQTGELNILARRADSLLAPDGSDASDLARGQAAQKTLGPFRDEWNALTWYDIFETIPLNGISYKGDTSPFLLFSAVNSFALLQATRIELQPGSIWIRAAYFHPSAPSTAYVGLRVAAGTISWNQPTSITGNSLVLENTIDCQLTIQLHPPALTFNSSIGTGLDARDSEAVTPDEMSIKFHFQHAAIMQLTNGKFSLYNNSASLSWMNTAALYDPLLKKILIPFTSEINSLNISQTNSTLFKISGESTIQAIYWTLPVSVADPSQLGEASGCGGYLIQSEKGLIAGWQSLDKTMQISSCSWILEPGKLELYSATQESASSQFFLWHKVEKRASATLTISKNTSIHYTCSALQEAEWLLSDAHLTGNFDRPLTTDGAKIRAVFSDGKSVLTQYKQENSWHCGFSKILEKEAEKPGYKRWTALSLALSNAFAKISPCDEFYVGGKLINTNEIGTGSCGFVFGLMGLLPIFPDPYVSTLQLSSINRERGFSPTEFQNKLKVSVNWKDIYDPLLSFELIQQTGSLFGEPISRKRENSQSLLEDRIPAAYSFFNVNNPIQTVLKEDRENENALRNNFQDLSGGRYHPDLFILDVSGNLDHFGVGLSDRAIQANKSGAGFRIEGVELVCHPEQVSVMTLPPVQWEAVETIPNVATAASAFPSPADSLDTGDPAILRTLISYELIPLTPAAVTADFVRSFSEQVPASEQRGMAYINLPFGLKSVLRLQHRYDHSVPEWGIRVENNRPEFKRQKLTGAHQLSLAAFHYGNFDPSETESPGFPGATIQTRNLIDRYGQSTGLSVLGPLVDSIFNNEFGLGKPTSSVPLKRIDLSGYGASIFSNWLNPKASIAATSQAKFDVIVGRTAHEIIQVKSILYCNGASVVRTVTIQRTGSGGVKRHDSGWVAEGPGLFDFTYTPFGASNEINPYEFDKGQVRGCYNITNIRDTTRIVEIPVLKAGDSKAKLQEVLFDADLLIEDVIRGQKNGWVSTKSQKGFVQLEPIGAPISDEQLKYLLRQEGPIGGPVECSINIGGSGQEMRLIRVDTNPDFSSNRFVNAVRGSLVLPEKGDWGIVRNKAGNFEALSEQAGLPLIRYNASPEIYRFIEPGEDPAYQFGLVHASSSHRVLFPGPYIQKLDPVLRTGQPAFADIYALLNSNNIFPAFADSFPVGAGEGALRIHGSGLLELISSGKLNISPGPRSLYKDASFASYIEYFDEGNPAQGTLVINPLDPEQWKAQIGPYKLVYDVGDDQRVKTFHLSYSASGIQSAKLEKPRIELGASLKTVGEMMRMLDNGDLGEIQVDCHNIESSFKYQMAYEGKIEFELHSAGFEKVVHFWPFKFPKNEGGGEEKVLYYGLPALVPPFLYFEAKLAILAFRDEKAEYLGVKIEATLGVQVMNVLKAAAIYAVGIFEYKIKFGTAVKQESVGLVPGGAMALVREHSFKMIFACAVRINLVKIGEIEGMRGFGIEYSTEEKKVIAVITQKVEIAIATCSVGVTIEAKAPVEKIKDSINPTDPLDTVDRFVGSFELSLVLEISVAYIVNFEYEYTWKEMNKIF